ncbi:hypothetical protein H632_c2224p0, partial [Helicosporidium sp. ATCC 50920]
MSGDLPTLGGADATALPLLPRAEAASIIRAEQKDEIYIQQLNEACQDAVRHVLGPRRSVQWSREIQTLSQLLYYSLTTGSGLQTLGEEYCEILQASGSVDASPGTVRRCVLAFLQSVGPYVADRTLAPAPIPNESQQWLAQARQLQAQRRERERATAEERAARRRPESPGFSLAKLHRAVAQGIAEALRSAWAAL